MKFYARGQENAATKRTQEPNGRGCGAPSDSRISVWRSVSGREETRKYLKEGRRSFWAIETITGQTFGLPTFRLSEHKAGLSAAHN